MAKKRMSRKTAKIVFMITLFGTVTLNPQAQDRFTSTVSYYKQTAVVTNGSRTAGDGTGQFVCINPKGCYDSDKDGYTVDNGYLAYKGMENNVHIYQGDSYWGKAYYWFTADYSRLNVKLDGQEKIYVYEKTAAPQTTLTSAKIKEKPKPERQDTGIITWPVQNNNNQNNNQNNNNGRVTPPPPPPPPAQTKCRTCGGSGNCTSCRGTGNCTNCRGTGRLAFTNAGRYIGESVTVIDNCGVCGGTGKCGTCYGNGKCIGCRGKGYY